MILNKTDVKCEVTNKCSDILNTNDSVHSTDDPVTQDNTFMQSRGIRQKKEYDFQNFKSIWQ